MLVKFASFSSGTPNGPPRRIRKELGCNIASRPLAESKMVLHLGAQILVKGKRYPRYRVVSVGQKW